VVSLSGGAWSARDPCDPARPPCLGSRDPGCEFERHRSPGTRRARSTRTQAADLAEVSRRRRDALAGGLGRATRSQRRTPGPRCLVCLRDELAAGGLHAAPHHRDHQASTSASNFSSREQANEGCEASGESASASQLRLVVVFNACRLGGFLLGGMGVVPRVVVELDNRMAARFSRVAVATPASSGQCCISSKLTSALKRTGLADA
jgi:hypothetical protein